MVLKSDRADCSRHGICVTSLNMRKWMKDRLQRRKKKAPEQGSQPAPPPLQPAYFDAEQSPTPISQSDAEPEAVEPDRAESEPPTGRVTGCLRAVGSASCSPGVWTSPGNRASKALAEKLSEDADAAVVAGGVVVDEAASKRLPRRSVQRVRRGLFLTCRHKK